MAISTGYVHYTVDVSFNVTDAGPRTYFALHFQFLTQWGLQFDEVPIAHVKENNKQKNGD